MYDDSFYELTEGANSIDEKLEALISGALNSTIAHVIGSCESGIHHFLTWSGSEDDEIYLGFKTVIESYIEDTGKTPEVDWESAYRRIMDAVVNYDVGNATLAAVLQELKEEEEPL